MKAPTIDKLKNTGTHLVATVAGQEVTLSTFREILWLQGCVYLPEPFTDKCPKTSIFSIPGDDESDLMEVEGVIHDREVAGWMRDFAAGKLKVGKLR